MVIVDVQNKATGIPTDAYLAIEEIKDVRLSCFSVFKPHSILSEFAL